MVKVANLFLIINQKKMSSSNIPGMRLFHATKSVCPKNFRQMFFQGSYHFNNNMTGHQTVNIWLVGGAVFLGVEVHSSGQEGCLSEASWCRREGFDC